MTMYYYKESKNREALYNKNGKLDSKVVEEINPTNHTMPYESFRRYIGRYGQDKLNINTKKISPDQAKLIAEAYEHDLRINVISAYQEDLPYLLAQNSARIIGDKIPYEKNSKIIEEVIGLKEEDKNRIQKKQIKSFNKRRQLMCMVDRSASDKPEELWVLVFPSKEYVNQVAELIKAIVSDFKKEESPKKDGTVLVSHFPDLENTIVDWTGFADFASLYVRHGDVVVIGNVELLLPGLKKYAFHAEENNYIDGGLGNIFSANVCINKFSFSRLVLIGIDESFWGSASAQYATSLMELGASHVLYASKAATLDKDHVHEVYAPADFYLLTENRLLPESISYKQIDIDDFLRIWDIKPVRGSITVPTVIGELLGQRKVMKDVAPICLDCENGHIAKATSEFNTHISLGNSKLSVRGSNKYFFPVHFITDYIYNTPMLSDADGSFLHQNVDPVRNEIFDRIAHVFATYALAVGIHEEPFREKEALEKNETELGFKAEFEKVRTLLDVGFGREAITELSVREFSDGHRMVALMVRAMICQKEGYIKPLVDCINKLKAPSAFENINEEDKTQIEVIELKAYSQVGSISRITESLANLNGKPSLLKKIEQFGAVKRREAILHARLGNRDAALAAISNAFDKSPDAHDQRYLQTNVFFDLIARLALVNEKVDLKDVSEKLSTIRTTYCQSNTDGQSYQTNYERAAVAALFLEAAYYLNSKNNPLIEEGIKILLVAHLLNRRVKGNPASETYAEIILCTPDKRVKNILSLAMRADDAGQIIIQRWVHAHLKENLYEFTKEFSKVLKAGMADRETKIKQLFKRI